MLKQKKYLFNWKGGAVSVDSLDYFEHRKLFYSIPFPSACVGGLSDKFLTAHMDI